jgi:hypothetical protein
MYAVKTGSVVGFEDLGTALSVRQLGIKYF